MSEDYESCKNFLDQKLTSSVDLISYESRWCNARTQTTEWTEEGCCNSVLSEVKNLLFFIYLLILFFKSGD